MQRTGRGQLDATGGEKTETGERRRVGRGGMTRGMDALARHARVIETNSIPRIVSDARTRRGPFWNRESAVSEFEKAMREGPESDGFSPLTAGVESAGDRIPRICNLYHVAFANIIEDLCGRVSFYQNLPEI